MSVELKADRSPLTAVDRQVEALLIERLQARSPKAHFVPRAPDPF